jgi:hypothetical protein
MVVHDIKLKTLQMSTCNTVATLVLRDCEDEDSHSQMNSYFGSWNPGELPNLQREIAEVKTPCIEEFFISLESY